MKYTCGCGFMTESWKERKEHIKKCGGRPVNEPPSHAKPSREYLERKKASGFEGKWSKWLSD